MRLHELRSHSGINKKVSRDDQLKDIADRYGVKNMFATYTSINKFGMNVSTKYAPMGIYAFPLEYVLNTGANKVPLGTGYPFIQVFKSNVPKENTWVLSGKLNEPLVYRLSTEIQEYSHGNIKVPAFKSNKSAWDFMIMQHSADYLVGKHPAAVSTRTILINAGVYAVIDNGKSIIHPAEPTQAIFLDKGHLQLITTIVGGNIKYGRTDFTKIKDKDHFAAAIKSKELDPFDAFIQAEKMPGVRIKEYEDLIKQDSFASVSYAQYMLGTPWPEAESVIANNKKDAYRYAKDVLKDPNPETWAERYKKKHNI